MKIVINKTSHGIYINGTMLIPGTNCLEAFDEKSDAAKFFIEDESIEVNTPDKMDEKEQKNAVKNANTKSTLETLQKTFKKVDTSKQKKKLDDFEKSIKDAAKAEETEEDSEEE